MKYSTREQRAKSIPERFWEKVDRGGECWLWTAGQRNGYGGFSAEGKRWRAHRWSYERTFGPIPPGMDIDHKCRQKLCVRPDHLQAVTRTENLQNLQGARSTSSTGIRGVTWHPGARKYQVSASRDGRRHYAGLYSSIAEAQAAAIALRNRIMTNNLADRIKESR